MKKRELVIIGLFIFSCVLCLIPSHSYGSYYADVDGDGYTDEIYLYGFSVVVFHPTTNETSCYDFPDVTALAINLIKHRLRKQFSLGTKQINVDGLPTDLTGARELFKKDPFEFEYWALDLINAMPAQSKSKENMRGTEGVTFSPNLLLSFETKYIDIGFAPRFRYREDQGGPFSQTQDKIVISH